MGAESSKVEDFEFLGFTPESRLYKVVVSGQIIFLTFDAAQADWMTRVLNAAKAERKKVGALRMLCGDLHLSETAAEGVLYTLKTSDYESPASWDRSSTAIN